MLALSVKQPWAELIARGRKDLEIRSWSTDYRGPLLIVASSRPDVDGWDQLEDDASVPVGAAVALVDLVKVLRCGSMKAAELRRRACWPAPADCYAWELSNPRRTQPTAVKGRLRLYEVTTPIYLEAA